MLKPTHAYIHVSLCDNDFGIELEEAVTRVFASLGTTQSEISFQECVAELTIALDLIRNAAFAREPGLHVREYLTNRIRVEYSNEPPTADHDGGSVAVDTNLNYIWRY